MDGYKNKYINKHKKAKTISKSTALIFHICILQIRKFRLNNQGFK